MRPITNSDYREHTAPIFAKLGILDILQVDALQIAKYKFYYHNQLLPPMFLSSFPENRQVHSYDTRIADRKSTRLNSSHVRTSRMPSSA